MSAHQLFCFAGALCRSRQDGARVAYTITLLSLMASALYSQLQNKVDTSKPHPSQTNRPLDQL